VHEEVFAVRDAESSLEIVGWRAQASTHVEEDQSLTLHPGSELDIESSREIYVAGGGWREVPVLGSARITEVRGPAVLELPGTSIVLNADALATRSTYGSIVITTAIPSNRIASDAREFHAA
jgi:N-methylhydantoinase A